ncbi:MAG: type VI secretion system tip protein VgrG [Polyangiaceae bacterium]|nr:type VI secretion system tip protein VgrG [Polyangiaceae bacterium]
MSAFDAPVFDLSIPDAPHALHVVSFRGREVMSKPYRFDITVIGPELDSYSIEVEYVGQRAWLTLGGSSDEPRIVSGVICKMEATAAPIDAAAPDKHQYKLCLVPGFWLLRKGRDSRIFQDKTAVEIVCSLLSDRGVRVRLALSRSYEARNYCVQYEESDLLFVERLLREEGIYYFFEPPDNTDDDEVMVLADDRSGAVALPGNKPLLYREQATDHEALTTVQQFRLQRRLAAGTALLKDFDFRRPSYPDSTQASTRDLLDPLSMLGGLVETAISSPQAALDQLQSMASNAVRPVRDLVNDPTRALRRAEREARRRARAAARGAISTATSALSSVPGVDMVRSHLPNVNVPGFGTLGLDVIEPKGYLGADEAVLYDHHREHETTPLKVEHARVFLEQERRSIWEGSGSSRCHHLMPGRRFVLNEAPADGQNGEYTVFEVHHKGQDPAFARQSSTRIEVYSCEFGCVPAAIIFRPRPRKRVAQQVLETATVVGPAGQEIYTDPHGRVKVQFHWDRGGKRNEHSSCWIRVSHPWAGGGFGVQFLPRVGCEVTVGFLGGDIDRPLILGVLHNAEKPPPFPLPAEKTKSGIKTESTRGGGGYNELSFEDRKGYERVHIRAEKDLDVLVRNNETIRVEANQVTNVGVNQYSVVTANRISAVGGNDISTITGNQTSTVEGDRVANIKGQLNLGVDQNAGERFARDLHTRVEGNELHEVFQNAEMKVEHDLAFRVLGNYSVVVGNSDARRSSVIHTAGMAEVSSDEKLVLQADKGIQLVCGRSIVSIGKDHISLCSPEVGIYTPGAKMVFGDKKVRCVADEDALIQAQKTHLRGVGAAIDITEVVQVVGSAIQLVNGTPPVDTVSGPGRRRLTKIQLSDQEGNPMPFERFVVHLEDGSERVGVLDEHGKGEVEIQGGGEATITFPDVANVEAR